MQKKIDPLVGFGVILLVSIVAFFVVNSSHEVGREKPRQKACMNNQRRIAIAVTMYQEEHGGQLPGTITKVDKHTWAVANFPASDKTSWRTLNLPAKVFICKSNSLAGATGNQADYGYNATLLGAKLSDVSHPSLTILTTDTNGTDIICTPDDINTIHAGGYIASFMDGHVQYSKLLPANPPALDPATDSVTLDDTNKSAFMLNSVDVITVDPAKKTPASITAHGNLYTNSYLTFYLAGGTTQPVDALHVTSSSGHVTKVLIPAGAHAGDIYVITMPDSLHAGWTLGAG